MAIDDTIDDLIEREGREYTNRPADRGGATKFGITLRKLIDYRQRPCTEQDVMGLTEAEARAIYRDDFVVRPGYMRIADERVRAFAVDAAVQHGVTSATKMLQTAAHVFPDGKLGPQTEYAVNRMTPRALFLNFYIARQLFYAEIIAHDPELKKAVAAGHVKLQALNALGWARRITGQLIEGIRQ